MRSKAAFILSFLLAFYSLSGLVWASQALVLQSEGPVEVKDPGQEAWRPVSKDTAIDAGAEVRSGDGATAEIGLGDEHKSVIRLKPKSQASLETMDAQKIRLGLKAGNVFVLVRNLPSGSTFEVASPTAVATARGTGWEQGLDEIKVFEHSVDVAASNGESMKVEEGMGLGFKEEGLGELFEIPAAEKEEWKEFAEAKAEERASGEGTAQDKPASDDSAKPGANPPNDPDNPGESSGPTDPSMMGGAHPETMMEPKEPASADEDMLAPKDETTEPPDKSFDSFNDQFGSAGFENPAAGDSASTNDVHETLTEAHEQVDQSLPPPEFDPTKTTSMCKDSVGNTYPC